MASPYEQTGVIRQLAISAIVWTDVSFGSGALAIDCNAVVVMNTSSVSIKVRSDPNNASSEVTLAAGQAFTFGAAYVNLRDSSHFRYPVGSPFPVCAVFSTSGAQTITVSSLQ